MIYTIQDFKQPYHIYRALKNREKIELFASERWEYVPDFGLVTINGPKYANPPQWQVVVEVELVGCARVVKRFIGSPKPVKQVKVRHFKAAPAADLAWGWPKLHEQKMTVRPDTHTSELKRDISDKEQAMLERIGREDF